MQTTFKQHRLIFPLVVLILVLVFATTVYAADYHGINVNYFASSYAHYGSLWLSHGHIDTSQYVDQIGTTFWSTLEYCGSNPIWASYYSFNGSINYQNYTYTRSFFRSHYDSCGNQANKFRTYIQFYVQDSPYAGQEWPDVDWATW